MKYFKSYIYQRYVVRNINKVNSKIQTIKLMEKTNISPAKRQIKTTGNESIQKEFKEYAKIIFQSISKLNNFTDNLQGKVSTMLKAQQTQFVNGYTAHMFGIKNQLKQMQIQLLQYQSKVQYYENQGRLSQYIKKVNSLEAQQIKLYKQITQKDKRIKDYGFQLQMLKKQIQNSNDLIKQLYKTNLLTKQLKQRQDKEISFYQKEQQKLASGQAKHLSSIQTFATEIPNYNFRLNSKRKLNLSSSKEILSKIINQDQQKQQLFKSQQFQTVQKTHPQKFVQYQIQSGRIYTLQKENNQLKSQNKKLLTFNSKYASNLSELGQFFLKTIEELKKSISLKRKLSQKITFQQFCKQDKLVLIATLLSNQSALMMIYDKIFKPNLQKSRAQSVLQKSYGKKQLTNSKNKKTIQEIMTNSQNSMQVIDKSLFPSIKSKKLIY